MRVIKDKTKKIVQEVLSKNYNLEIEVDIENPKNENFGDFSTNIALKISKTLSKNPSEIANEIVQLLPDIEELEKVEVAAPGFINFYINSSQTKKIVNEVLKKGEEFGSSDVGVGRKWLIEHTSINPNKAMHLGHLRNNITGVAISNLWENIGIEVTRDYVDNNRGIALAKLMWGYLKFARKSESTPVEIDYWFDHQDEWKNPEDLAEKPDHFIDKLYSLASEDFKDPEVEEKVRKFVVDWENEEPKNRALWELVLNYSHVGQKITLDRLGSKIDKIWHEHEHYKLGKSIVEDGLKKGIFVKTDDGAVLTNLKEYRIPDTIVIKKDGTSLYITQDLALTKLKKEEFAADKLFWVVGPDQSLALKQVFAVCEQLGIGKFEDFTHLSFGYVTLKGEGKMSSRKGNVVYVDQLLDQVRDIIFEKINNDEISDEEKIDIAEKIGVGSVKYSMLKVGRLTDTAFDFETSLSFEGDSAPYVIYTYTRCRSILAKLDGSEIKELDGVLNSPEELEILKKLSNFPEVLVEAAENSSPNLVVNFVYELAQSFNSFYTKHQILNSEDKKTQEARIALTKATSIVLEKGLKLIGINVVERM